MKPHSYIPVVIVMGCLLFPGFARCNPQYPAHNELWTRINVIHNFSPNFRIESEYQYRWQNNPANATSLPSCRLAQGARLWLYRKLNNHFTAALSPFCWFKSYPVINSGTDFSKSNINELRASAGGEIKYPAGRFELKCRVIYETRFFSDQGSREWIRKDRARARTIISIPLCSDDSSGRTLSAFAGNEYFFQGQGFFTSNTAFDQNRLIVGFSWKANDLLKFDVCYMHIFKNAATGHFIERVIWLNTSFTI